MLRTDLDCPERRSSRVCPLPMPARPCPHSAPRTQPMKSSWCPGPGRGPGRALVTGVPKQASPRGHQARPRGPAKCKQHAWRPDTGALQRAGCPLPPSQQTIISALLEGPRQPAPPLGAGDCRGGLLPPPTPAMGSGNLRGRTRRGQRPAAQQGAKQRGVGGKLSGEGWAGWSQGTNFPA